MTLHAWIVAAMVALAPPGRPTFITAAQESKSQAMERYEKIADAITEVVLDPDEAPVVNRKFTAALLVSLTFHESAGWRRDVDLDLDRLRLAGTGCRTTAGAGAWGSSTWA